MTTISELSALAGAAGDPDVGARESSSARERPCDEAAFGSLFERYADPVFGFIYRMVGRHDLAEELAQETFVRAYRQMQTLRLNPDTKLSTWLFGVAKNVARESLRSAGRDGRKVELDDDAVAELSDEAPGPDARLLSEELDRVVQRALQSLDEDKRLVFTLRVLQQSSYKEIAEVTGHSIAKVKTDLFRARAEMRRLVSPYMEMPDEV
jgi:RNA polymerase sigma-70 factor (ECF subfamily)